MTLKSVVKKAVGFYLLVDNGIDVVSDVGGNIIKNIDDPADALKYGGTALKQRKVEAVKATIGASLLGIDLIKPVKEMIMGKPKKRSKNR